MKAQITRAHLEQAAAELNRLIDLDPSIQIAGVLRETLENDIREASKELLPTDKLTEETVAALTALGIELPIQPKPQRPYVTKTVRQLADEFYKREKALSEFQTKQMRDFKEWLLGQLPKNG